MRRQELQMSSYVKTLCVTPSVLHSRRHFPVPFGRVSRTRNGFLYFLDHVVVHETLSGFVRIEAGDKSLLLGMITREGSSNSHTAILARSMNLPSLIQCKDIDDSWDGKMAILDGYNSCVYIEPTDDLMQSLSAKHAEDVKKLALLQELKGKPSVTLDGTSVHVYANIGGPSDLGSVNENDAEGVGLFRSEFVYLNSKEEPTEEQQFTAYKRVVETLAPKLVIIRTCDIGADKTIDYMHLDKEENPALGFRAIRICLTRKEFFKKQLRALLRASAYGNMGIMFPMIISKWELVEAKAIMEEMRQIPEYKELVALSREYNELQMQLPYETEADKKRGEALQELRERVLKLLAEDEGVDAPVIPAPHYKRVTKEELNESKQRKLDQLAELLSRMSIPPSPSPAKVRNYAMAQKPAGVRLAWKCNYKNALHSSPCGCAKPQMGGTWVILGHNSKQEIKDDK